MNPPLLAVDRLTVRFGAKEVVSGASFALGRERLGIVGESGSGKSLTARAILRLLPPGAALAADRLDFDGIDLLRLDERRMRALRGRRVALVLQDAKLALNPMLAVGKQIAESYRVRAGTGRLEAREKTLALLEDVHIREPARIYDFRPHQLSGGMAQRVMIAMMLALDPDLLIADEPTSALDPTVRAQVLALLDEQIERRRMGLILISHDLRLVQSFCDRILVMRSGSVVEHCAAADLAKAHHPYTRRLLEAGPPLLEP